MPTSREFHEIPVGQITIPEGRQRQSISDIEPLALSIQRIGLLHPIVVRRTKELVVGERRYRAAAMLGWETIPAQFIDELSSQELDLVELEENMKRQDLTWQEDCLAHLRFHQGQEELHDGIWSTEMSAEYLGCHLRTLQRRIEVARALESGDEGVSGCESVGAAYTVLSRKRDRALGSEAVILDDAFRIDVGATSGSPTAQTAPTPGGEFKAGPPPWERNPVRPVEEDIICADFREWAKTYEGEPFNFLHVDFPYGIAHHESEQGAADKWETYTDTEKVYVELLRTLLEHRDRVIAPSAHVMFWLSMNQYEDTVDWFRLKGFTVNPRPLIWAKSDNVGILPDPLRGPRQTYELALFISLGGRKIAEPVADVCWFPGSRHEAKHQSEKPWGMLKHFFRLFVDEHTAMLDPTCGSGNALACAWKMGAQRVLGMDLSDNHVETARSLLRQTRMVMASGPPEEKSISEGVSLDDIKLDI
jgi:ParB/RepB/Spo0J family partition protein